MKKWETVGKLKIKNKRSKIIDEIVDLLLKNRGLKTKKEIEEFLNPKLEKVTIKSVGIDNKQVTKAVARIKKAIEAKEQIVVYGDYDVDGICGSAILWETLHGLGAKVLPYIPHRIDEGYGLSVKGIQNVINVIPNSVRNPNKILKQALEAVSPQAESVQDDNRVKLIITVDNGIVANDAVDFANKNGIDVIITDHHVPSKKLPKAYAIVHTTRLCGGGVAYMLAQEIRRIRHSGLSRINKIEDSGVAPPAGGAPQNDDWYSHLELVALATIADLVPLLGANRTLTKFGLEQLQRTKRVGLLELFKEAAIDPSMIGTYEVGHIIAPRLNAMGRLEHAMDSLRLLCTKDQARAQGLAHKLGSTNRERQMVTEETVLHAKQQVTGNTLHVTSRKLLFISHESYQQGVIGLVAGKLVEEFYRPAIVVSKGEKYSKASARSVHGFNIIEFIRSASEFLVDAGGHPMAAGFTVETEKLSILQDKLEELAEKVIDGEKLTRTLRIDCEISLSDINNELYERISQFEPFGMNNPAPTFMTRKVIIEDMRLVGAEGRHVKLRLASPRHSGPANSGIPLRRDLSRIRPDSGVAPPAGGAPQNDGSHFVFDAIAFGMGERAHEFHIGDTIDIVYTIEEDRWDGNRKLQLKIKDIKRGSMA